MYQKHLIFLLLLISNFKVGESKYKFEISGENDCNQIFMIAYNATFEYFKVIQFKA